MSVDETALLSAAVFDREAFDSVRGHFEAEDLSATSGAVWTAVGTYYRTDPRAKVADPRILLDRLVREYPKQKDTFVELFGEFSPDRGGRNIALEALEVKRRSAGDALVTAISQQRPADEIAPYIAAYRDVNDATGLLQAGGGAMFSRDLGELITATEEEGARTVLLPRAVNAYLRGGLLPGHCVIIFGRVNVGKSALAINAGAGFLRQHKRVLYIENEDLLEDTSIRFGTRIVGKDRDWAYKNASEFEDIAMKRGYGNLLLPDPAPDTVLGIERMIQSTEPDVCIVNQARNLVQGTHNVVAQLDQIANGLRNVGKRNRVIMVLVTAAKEGAEDYSGDVKDKTVLEKHDVYSSRTGFPAVGDLMLGYGVDRALEDRNMAAISICKNKIGKLNGKSHGVVYVKADYDRSLIKGTNE
jgi:hypothetical protein